MLHCDPGLNNVVVLLGFVILGLIVKLKFIQFFQRKSDQIKLLRSNASAGRYVPESVTYRHTDIQTYRQTETKKRVGIIRM